MSRRQPEYCPNPRCSDRQVPRWIGDRPRTIQTCPACGSTLVPGAPRSEGSRQKLIAGIDRRVILKGAAAASASLLLEQAPLALAVPPETDHAVPADKGLDPEWIENLFSRGSRKVYCGPELETIGMPCGGICAGQLYVRGDGTLARWWIANNAHKTVARADDVIRTPLGEYQSGYRTYRPASHVNQGFAIRVEPNGSAPLVRTLDRDQFDDIRFVGEYPIAQIVYRSRYDPQFPVGVELEVYSPFIPLNVRDSAQPGTVLRFTVRNNSPAEMSVSIAGWLQNAACLDWEDRRGAYSRNRVIRHAGLTSVQMDALPPLPPSSRTRRVVIFEDFEGNAFQNWSTDGDAFDMGPAGQAPPGLEVVRGWKGDSFASSFGSRGDAAQGRLISRTFRISEPYLAFLMGSGMYGDRTTLNLLVAGRVVRTASGRGNPRMEIRWWDVEDLIGLEAHLEIVDLESRAWGHLTVDHIYFTNQPPEGSSLRDDPQFGDLALSVLDPQARASANWESKAAFLTQLKGSGKLRDRPVAKSPLGEELCGAVSSSFRLQGGEARDVTFFLTWYFPNRQQDNCFVAPGAPSGTGRPVGNMYANWHRSSLDVARYLAENFERLHRQTHLFRETYFDTSLPYWFAQRVAMQASTLATETCQWWANGRFWGFEGVGCCPGTCNHVWHYDQTMARLFPDLQRSVLSMQILDPRAGFVSESGMILFRGEGWNYRELWRGGDGPEWAADGQAASILMALRAHQLSPDETFLKNHWIHIRRAIDFLIDHDGHRADGVIEGQQPNTYDGYFFGANSMVGSLYLAALRAGRVMARAVGENDFAEKCRRLFESGSQLTVERLFNGEYFVQEVDLGEHPDGQYANGCLSDQLIGQTWAHLLDLGYLYPRQQVLQTLKSIWKYNWAPDVGAQSRSEGPPSHFAHSGEAGLLLCTWPKGRYRGSRPMRYRYQVWAGIEFQVAAGILYEGQVLEALAIVRAVHDRYDASRHNPWNLIECGDHYARAMASWGCLLAITGFVLDAPNGKIGFAPRLTPENFKAFFSAAEGWGSLVQKRSPGTQTNRIEVKWGRLKVKTLILQLPDEAILRTVHVLAAGRRLEATAAQKGSRLTVTLGQSVVVGEGQVVDAKLTFEGEMEKG